MVHPASLALARSRDPIIAWVALSVGRVESSRAWSAGSECRERRSGLARLGRSGEIPTGRRRFGRLEGQPFLLCLSSAGTQDVEDRRLAHDVAFPLLSFQGVPGDHAAALKRRLGACDPQFGQFGACCRILVRTPRQESIIVGEFRDTAIVDAADDLAVR
jgi:hypothetical protein